MVDGSAHFLNYTMDHDVLLGLSSRDGNETTNAF